MIVVMQPGATQEQIQAVIDRVAEFGFQTKLAPGAERMVIGVVGSPLPDTLKEALERLPGVEEVIRVSKRYKLVSREFYP
ncbi:MAG: 3-deoxy-7-phosphoheptulonate synthase, partial [Thermomicrobium sp.]|nr:3-deoxy-7-phosphoheptulonate synthase [Thermomicrobium sp.]